MGGGVWDGLSSEPGLILFPLNSNQLSGGPKLWLGSKTLQNGTALK